MSLSETVEDTLAKLKPHHEELMDNPTPAVSSGSNSKFSLNLDTIKDYLILIVGFGITLVSVFLLIIPQYGQISEMSGNLSVVQTKRDEVKKQSEYLEGLVGLKDELESNISLADQVLPSSEDRVPYTLDQLIQIAESASVSVDSLSLSGISEPTPDSTDNLRVILIQLSVTGYRDDIQNFLYKLEKARTLVDVSTFQLASELTQIEDAGSEDSDSPTFTSLVQEKATLTLKSYLKADVESQAVDLSALANSPNYEALFKKLNEMDFYETTPLDIEFGRDNPFEVVESTPSVILNEEPTIEPEIDEEDASGFQ